jgi:pimeloyl-ACP methyl ester carboxylesterase
VNKRINRFLMFSVVLMVLAMVVVQFPITVNAKKPEVSYNSFLHFTRVVGELGGAGYELFMPDNWNGMLVIGVRGYAHAPTFDIETSGMHALGMAFMTLPSTRYPDTERWAYAWSTFGEGGFCIQKGMIRTHQLTEYVIDNYDVHGKVFLMGMSMGGLISCLLAEKYPNLYDGVLDVCGLKDVKSFYEFQQEFTSLPNPLVNPDPTRDFLINGPAKLPEEIVNAIPVVADPGLPSLMSLRNLAVVSMADEELEFGGTPETKPKAYERYSATYNAGITVPVVSMMGEFDGSVPLYQFDMYYDAVAEAESLAYYRSYTIPGAGHLDSAIMAARWTYFELLADWVVGGVVPDSTPAPVP